MCVAMEVISPSFKIPIKIPVNSEAIVSNTENPCDF